MMFKYQSKSKETKDSNANLMVALKIFLGKADSNHITNYIWVPCPTNAHMMAAIKYSRRNQI